MAIKLTSISNTEVRPFTPEHRHSPENLEQVRQRFKEAIALSENNPADALTKFQETVNLIPSNCFFEEPHYLVYLAGCRVKMAQLTPGNLQKHLNVQKDLELLLGSALEATKEHPCAAEIREQILVILESHKKFLQGP